MSNYYLCDVCSNNRGSKRFDTCDCSVAKEAITKLPISDGQKCLDVCLWFYPTSWAKQKRGK